MGTWECLATYKMYSISLTIAIICCSLASQATALDITWEFFDAAKHLCVKRGETVSFNWEGDGHNVVQVDREAWVTCGKSLTDGFENQEGEEGPASFVASKIGSFYFVCGVGGHCEFGNQKANITVASRC